MFRKVVQQGPSTMMVSLPMAWVKANRIKKGDLMSVDIVNNALVLSPDSERDIRTATITIKRREDYLDRLLMTKYREGYDQLIVRYEDPETIKEIRSTLRYLLGFEIINQATHACTIKALSRNVTEDYDTTFRRLFQIVTTMAECCLTYAEKKDDAALLAAIDLRETHIALEQFCLRIVNEQNSRSLQRKSMESFYIWQIGALGRMWASLARLCLEKRIRFSVHDIAFLRDVVGYTRDFQSTYYGRELSSIVRIKKKHYTLRVVGATALERSHHPLVAFYLLRMVNQIYEITRTF